MPHLDGTPMQGPGGYTNRSVREAYRPRVEQKLGLSRTGGHADTTEAAERAVVLAARYVLNPRKVAETVSANCLLTQTDESIVAMTTAFNCVVALLVAGEKLDMFLSDKLMERVKLGRAAIPCSHWPEPGHAPVRCPGSASHGKTLLA
jgi:hypothetical protein